jgi:DnaJ-class molecular chaperone
MDDPPIRAARDEAIYAPDDAKCCSCNGVGFHINPIPVPFGGLPKTNTCLTCEGTGVLKLK